MGPIKGALVQPVVHLGSPTRSVMHLCMSIATIQSFKVWNEHEKPYIFVKEGAAKFEPLKVVKEASVPAAAARHQQAQTASRQRHRGACKLAMSRQTL